MPAELQPTTGAYEAECPGCGAIIDLPLTFTPTDFTEVIDVNIDLTPFEFHRCPEPDDELCPQTSAA